MPQLSNDVRLPQLQQLRQKLGTELLNTKEDLEVGNWNRFLDDIQKQLTSDEVVHVAEIVREVSFNNECWPEVSKAMANIVA